MTIRTSKQAITHALAQTANTPGTCQKTVRTWFNAPSAGDQDGDGDADAVDGWKSEPLSARRVGDRNPPPGKPLSFKGGSRGYGHRALSLVNGVRSTDMHNNRYASGITSTVTGTSVSDAIAKIERSMNVTYVGWSKTIDGYLIPEEPLVRPKRVPSEWNQFVHLDPNKFMNYAKAIEEAARRGIGVDIDGQESKEGTGWGAHWATVGKNHAHDPKGLIKPWRRLDSLTDAEIGRLEGPNGQKAFRRLSFLMTKAERLHVRVELEVKVRFSDAYVAKFMALRQVKRLRRQGRLQVKTLAKMRGPVNRLRPWQNHGAVTILSFTKYTGAGIRKSNAWPIVDYTRGKPVWI